jgi:hypothetical protein
MATKRIPPAGDPFHTGGQEQWEKQTRPHVCYDGFIYLGYTAVDEETGEEVERVEALPCRRCAELGAANFPPDGKRADRR